jgi:hypothetical protein
MAALFPVGGPLLVSCSLCTTTRRLRSNDGGLTEPGLVQRSALLLRLDRYRCVDDDIETMDWPHARWSVIDHHHDVETDPSRTQRCRMRLREAETDEGAQGRVFLGPSPRCLVRTCSNQRNGLDTTSRALRCHCNRGSRALLRYYRLRLITADPLSLRNRTVCDLPCNVTLITPEMPYSLL